MNTKLLVVWFFVALLTQPAPGNSQSRFQRIKIDNSANPTALYEFQILFELAPSNFDYSHSTDNGRDIRIRGEGHPYPQSGEYFPYWIQVWEPNGTSQIYSKIPYIPAFDTTVVYLEYGDSTLQSQADGDSVFDLFDDFNDAELNLMKWDIVTYSGSEGSLSLQNGELILIRPEGANPIAIRSDSILQGYKIIEYSQHMYVPSLDVGNSYYYHHIYYGIQDSQDTLYSSIGYASLIRVNKGEYESAVYSGTGFAPPRTYSFASTYGHLIAFRGISRERFVIAPDSLVRLCSDGQKEVADEYHGASRGYIGIRGQSPISDWSSGDQFTYIDYIFVRKYVAPEPIITLEETVTGTEHCTPAYPRPMLFPCHPNPFNPTTTIVYHLPFRTIVFLAIYDAAGRLICEPINNEFQESGLHSIAWNADNVTSGVYFCQLKACGYKKTIKLVLLR